MSKEAEKRILENIEKHRKGENASVLGLGNCECSELPELIRECVWITDLRLNENAKLVDLSPLAGLSNLQRLDCSSTQVSDLSPLAGLSNLQNLSCDSTQVSDLSPLAGLSNLQNLSCSFTQVSDLSPLAGLSNLQILHCRFTQVSDLSPLAGLSNLQTLDCSSTHVSDLSLLADLSNLQNLYCNSTEVSDLRPLTGLSKLQKLYCYSTQVIDLSPLARLSKLQTLSCHSIHLSDLSPLADLNNLKMLWCYSTQVIDLSPLARLSKLQTLWCNSTQVIDLSPLAGLSNLQNLSCDSTQVSDLSPLAGLSNLQTLDCSSSPISDLRPILPLINEGYPVKWQNRDDYIKEHSLYWDPPPAILVKDCPLIIPPVECARESPEAVRDYFAEIGIDSRKLNEVKVIFLGEASAGKTSLVKRLTGEKFDLKEGQTHGIRIRKAPFVLGDGETVTAHIWDFGGQEVMHATHQFFLSERSIYVLLLNSRNDDQAEKWLKHAAGFGGRSPVLVVLNKIDENPSFEVNRKTLRGKYPQICDFYRLSAKTDEGLEPFKQALQREIEQADTRRTPFPARWLAVKEHFTDMNADYTNAAEYEAVCKERGIEKAFSRDVLLQFLHDLGVIINFRNLKHFDTQILNPLWLTNGVYRIINSKIVAEAGGLLHEDDFDAVINDPRYHPGNTGEREYHYPKDKLLYIVRVMEEFELCFQLDTRTYVVPQLLHVAEPDFDKQGAMLHFVLDFPDFLPDSVFPRLMVKLHSYIEYFSEAVKDHHRITDKVWRTGMILSKPTVFQARARVRWDKEDQKILVDVCGEERRRFLSFIRETVKEIASNFTKLPYEENVPIPGTDDFFEYQYLVEAEKAGEKELFVKQLKKRVSLAELLDGVEEPAMRDETEQLLVKAFVSYSHADLEYIKELESALAPLMRLNRLRLWYDRAIDAGAAWEATIFQQLREADLVLCLVSANFIKSDFCYNKEFITALEAHRKGEQVIVPITLRKTDWDDLDLSKIQGLPTGTWIASAPDKDAAWTEVCKSLRPVLERIKLRKKALIEAHKSEFRP